MRSHVTPNGIIDLFVVAVRCVERLLPSRLELGCGLAEFVADPGAKRRDKENADDSNEDEEKRIFDDRGTILIAKQIAKGGF